MEDPKNCEDLYKFLDWALSPQGLGIMGRVPLFSEVQFFEGICSFIVGRWGRFQIEKIICKPNLEGLYYSEKNCNRWGVIIAGELSFYKESYKENPVTTSGYYQSALENMGDPSELFAYRESGGFCGDRIILPIKENFVCNVKKYGAVFLVFEERLDEDYEDGPAYRFLDDIVF